MQVTLKDGAERWICIHIRLLYRKGWEKQRILDLFAVLDWMMRQPDGLEQQLWQNVVQIGRFIM